MEAEGGEEERRDGAEVHHETRHHVHSRADVGRGHLATQRRASNEDFTITEKAHSPG